MTKKPNEACFIIAVEEITLQVPSLDPLFTIFIDMCLCDFQVVESFTVQVNQLIDA